MSKKVKKVVRTRKGIPTTKQKRLAMHQKASRTSFGLKTCVKFTNYVVIFWSLPRGVGKDSTQTRLEWLSYDTFSDWFFFASQATKLNFTQSGGLLEIRVKFSHLPGNIKLGMKFTKFSNIDRFWRRWATDSDRKIFKVRLISIQSITT